jgi:ABC-type sugar transport system ATPase subunit
VARVVDATGLSVDLRARVDELSQSARPLVALARALFDAPNGGTYLVLDEITAQMNHTLVERLFESLRPRVEAGELGVVFISHRLEEIYQVADHLSVIGQGRVSLDAPARQVPRAELLAALTDPGSKGAVGGPGRRAAETTAPVAVRSLAVRPAERQAVVLMGVSTSQLRSLDLVISPGQIFGVTGVEASGKEELVELLAGGIAPDAGRVEIEGGDGSRRGAVGVVPADRRRLGGIPDMSVADNLFLPRFRSLWRHGTMSRRREAAPARAILERYRVDPPEPDRAFGTLSGGNQQKVLIARWAESGVRVVVLHEPTAGIDIPSRPEIARLLRVLADDGRTIVYVSSDVEELPSVCDRVAVLADGRLAAILAGADLSVEAIVAASFGSRANPRKPLAKKSG